MFDLPSNLIKKKGAQNKLNFFLLMSMIQIKITHLGFNEQSLLT